VPIQGTAGYHKPCSSIHWLSAAYWLTYAHGARWGPYQAIARQGSLYSRPFFAECFQSD
jgi:hypothetical protein